MYCIDVLYVWEKIFVIYNESLGVREMEEKMADDSMQEEETVKEEQQKEIEPLVDIDTEWEAEKLCR